MNLTTLSANLRRLRAGRKLSQVDMAEQTGLSREGYRRIEDGLAEPRTESLLRIAKALGVQPADLLVPTRQLSAVRFRAQKRMTSREDLLADVARWLSNYAELESSLKARADFSLKPLCQKLRGARGATEPKLVAAEARKTLKLKEGELIRDICGLLEDNGVKVFTPSVASEGFFGLSVGEEDGGPAVVVNCWDRISVERWIFTAAHELGHLLLHLDAYNVSESEEDDGQEKEANLFASYFLMPDDAFEKEWEEARGLGLIERVFKVKRIFRVSWKTVVYRIADRSPSKVNIWAQFYGTYERSRGKKLKGIDEPEGLSPQAFHERMREGAPIARVADEPEHLLPYDFVEDRLRRLVRKAVDDGKISLGRAAEILDMDVKSMRVLAASWME